MPTGDRRERPGKTYGTEEIPAKSGPASPSEALAAVRAFDQFSRELVLLADYRLEEVERTVRGFQRSVREQLDRLATPGGAAAVPAMDAGERARFREAVDELDWFLGILRRDDHGGHRQALGQYGRLLCEALEDRLGPPRAEPSPVGTPRRTGSAGNPK